MQTIADNILVKKPYQKDSYTEEQLREFTKCADPVTGPEYFMSNYFYIQHPVHGRMLYKPYEYQKRLIDSYHNYRFTISLMPRQTGKSTSAAGYLLWYANFIPDSTTLIAAHKYAGSQEIMQRIRYAYESIPNFIRAGAVSYNKGSIDFDNGSRIMSTTTTENTGRGMSISLLYADEFAWVRPSISREFWTSISPTLTTGGKCIITSTPSSDEDQFALIWKGANKCFDEFGNPTKLGINGFKAFRSFWQEHPDRDEKWAIETRAQLGDERFKREMECNFIIHEETLISPIRLLEIAGEEPLFNQGNVRWYSQPQKDKVYVVAWDPSLGTGSDPAAMQVFEADTIIQVAEWKNNRTAIPEQVRILADILKFLADSSGGRNNIYYSIENNTIGEAGLLSVENYGEENLNGIFISEDRITGSSRRYRKGFTTTHKSKLAVCAKLKTLIESDKMKIKSKSLVSELKTFVAVGTSFAAKPGETDDLVMATVLMIRMLQQLQQYHHTIGNRLSDHNDVTIEPMPFIRVSR